MQATGVCRDCLAISIIFLKDPPCAAWRSLAARCDWRTALPWPSPDSGFLFPLIAARGEARFTRNGRLTATHRKRQ